MEYLEIVGGNPLCGEACIQGSKNAALPILSAVILHRGTTVLKNCPKIIDVLYMLEILKGFGCHVSWEGDTLVIDASDLEDCQVAECYGCKMRSSIMLLGSLLGRMGNAYVSYPGGCVIGERPIDMHLAALKKLGAVLLEEAAGLRAVCEKPAGAVVSLPFPSVGATENVILLAAVAEGVTILENAAREPEIGELCRFLNSMGARIRGAGTSRIEIVGVKELHDTEFTIMPDRIVAGTYMFMAGGRRRRGDSATGGSLRTARKCADGSFPYGGPPGGERKYPAALEYGTALCCQRYTHQPVSGLSHGSAVAPACCSFRGRWVQHYPGNHF